MRCGRREWTLWVIAVLFSGVCAADPRTDAIDFNIPAQTLEKSLREFHSQSGVLVFAPAEIPVTAMAPAVHGRLTPEVALQRLLLSSAVTMVFVSPNTFTLHVDEPLPTGGSEFSEAIPEVFIPGSRTLNTDQLRTEDDPFAYIIFDDSALSRSAAEDARVFLATELPAYSPRGVALGAAAIAGAGGQITVRGLPSSETVILHDGHRRAGAFAGGDMQQPDVSMIPLALLTRVEVRTASASALFGSDAVAGSINFVRDRKTPRTRFFLRAEELTGVSSGTQQVSAEHVMEMGQGRGWLALDAALLRQDAVTLGERNFLSGARQRMGDNNPDAYARASAPPLGLLRNVHVAGAETFPVGDGVRFLSLPVGFRAGDDFSLLAPSAGQYNFALAPSAQVLGEFSTIRPTRQIHSVSAAGGWRFSDVSSVDLDMGYAESLREGRVSALDDIMGQAFFVPALHPANPLRQDLWATSGTDIADGPMSRRDRSLYATLGTTWLFSKAAMLRLDHAWSTSSAKIRQPVLQGDTSGLIALLLSEPAESHTLADSGMWLAERSSPRYANALGETTLRFTNSHVDFPAGPASVTVSAQLQNEKTADGTAPEPVAPRRAAQRAQRTVSFAASANVPLVESRADKGPARVAVDLGLRRDSIVIDAAPDAADEQRTLRFASVSAAAGLHWRMLDSLSARIQCTTGFLPPPLSSISGMSSAYLEDLHLTDPARGGEPLEEALVISGGNYDLEPERAHACGGGFVLRDVDDEAEGHWRLSVDYTRLVKTHVVLTPADLFFLDPQRYLIDYAWRIRRAAPEAGGPWAQGPVVAIETWSANIARQEIESIDIRFDWSRRLVGGDLSVSLLGSAQPVSTRRLAASMSQENDAGVGSLASPIWRGVTSVTWERQGFTLGLAARYTSSYDVSRSETLRLSQGDGKVSSQTYADVFVAYDLPMYFFSDAATELRLDARNVLHRDPPADLGETGYGSRFGLEEFPSLSLSVNVRL